MRFLSALRYAGDRIVDDLAGDGDAEFLLPCLLLGPSDEDDAVAVIREAASVDTTHGWLPAVEGCGRFVEMPQMPYACHTGCRDTQDGHTCIRKYRIDAVHPAPTAEVPCCGQVKEPDEQRAQQTFARRAVRKSQDTIGANLLAERVMQSFIGCMLG